MTPQQATRDQAEALMARFAPRMGRAYATGRNFDHGPGAHRNVSGLSPHIRRRLLLERDLVATALIHHGHEGAAKFIQEVIWRSYFKGWLELRPDIWASYRDGLTADLAGLEHDPALAARVAAAEAGATGLACFDAWTAELRETGYLHNHARMWFASIWIFTLGLPWRIGADFFLRHLLDGDPASNTLGWRWVAGLHTRGKTYRAEAWNIAKFTANRFAPDPSDLAAEAAALAEREEPGGLPPVRPLRAPLYPATGTPTALLITEEDCRVEDFLPSALELRGVGRLHASHLRSPRPVAGAVAAFDAAALDDAARRAERVTGLAAEGLQAGTPGDLAGWAADLGARQIATPYIPEGPLRDWIRAAEPALAARGITLLEWRRDWDSAIWPLATAGFFKVKARIPRILDQAGLT